MQSLQHWTRRVQTKICMIFAVLFCMFTISIYMPANISGREVRTDVLGTNDSQSGTMNSCLQDNDLILDSVLVNMKSAGSNQLLIHLLAKGQYSSILLRYEFLCLVTTAVLAIFIRMLSYCQEKQFKIARSSLYVIITYVHNCDGKKSNLC